MTLVQRQQLPDRAQARPTRLPTRLPTTIRGAADVAQLRTVTYLGREHLVIPVVAMVGDTVIHTMHSPGPELVPVEELEKAPPAWNGRPVVPDHPHDGMATANDPGTLERMAFGQVFDARVESGRLLVEAWVDPGRAEQLGGDPQRVIDRVTAGELVEVSVGAWVTLEETPGVHRGDRYEYVWRDIVPDHLAMLPEGVPGACSVDIGCGAPRAARGNRQGIGARSFPWTAGAWPARDPYLGRGKRADDTHPGSDRRPTAGEESHMSTDRRRRLPTIHSSAEGPSDSDLREALEDELGIAEGERVFARDVYREDSTVIYEVVPENGPILMYQRVFEVSEDGTVSVGGDRIRVRERREYDPVNGGAGEGDPATAQSRAGSHAQSRSGLRSESHPGLQLGSGQRPPSMWTRAAQRALRCLSWPGNLHSLRPAEHGLSDVDLRDALDEALRATEPGYLGIEEVRPGDGVVIYAAAPGEQQVWYRRPFTLTEDGQAPEVSLADERTRVEPLMTWVEVEDPTTARAGGDCPCESSGLQTAGESLAGYLNEQIEDQVTEDRSRADIVESVADSAGISPSTVNQILNASIDCPPLERLEGIADALGISTGPVVSAAEDDGCTYDVEEG